jgi:hypothetical protein
LNAELRRGSQHCQDGTPKFLEQTFGLARQVSDKPLLVRLDSGYDALENMKVCARHQVAYVIKRNLRQERIEDWVEEAQCSGEWQCPREGKTVSVGNTYRYRDGHRYRIVFRVTERTMSREGQILLFPHIDVETYWTSLGVGCASAEEVVSIYHDHGTSEQFHSELKTDLGVERLPSGKFDTNALVLSLSIPVYTMLRLCGQVAMTKGYLPRKKVMRRRLRTVIQDLMYMASRLIWHARRLRIALSAYNPFRRIWAETYQCFAFP